MAFIPVLDCIRYTLVWLSPLQRFTNNFWTYGPEAADQDLIDLGNQVLTYFDTYFDTYVSEDVSLDEVQAIRWDEQGLPIFVSSGAAKPGLSSGEMFDLSLAIGLTVRTALRGRSYRGRMFFSGGTETHSADGLWDGAMGTALVTWWEAVMAAAPPLAQTMVVVSRQHNNVVLEEGTYTPVTGFEVRSLYPVHQRLRTPRP
jgi:hypothetical protein